MATVIIWHNPRCRTSRAGLKYLEDNGITPEIINYLKDGFKSEQLSEAIRMTGQPVNDFIRTNEADYKTLGLKGKELTTDEFARIAADHPKLLQRPIVIYNNKAVLAQPAERIAEIL